MKYVIFSGQWGDLYPSLFGDAIADTENVLYLEKKARNIFDRIFFRVILAKKIKQTWIKRLCFNFVFTHYKNTIKDFIKNETVIILVFRVWYDWLDIGLLDWINKYKKKFNCKTVYMLYDIVKSYQGNIDIPYLKNNFDLVLSFDFEDCEDYGITYYPSIYKSIVKSKLNISPKYDVFFCGAAKKRLDIILSVFEKLKSAGLKVDFSIARVEKKDRKYSDEINYIDFMPYDEYLAHVENANCLLEIMQDSAHHGYTVRTSEALMYGKKLLSNNLKIAKAPFYNPENIYVFSDVNEIRTDVLSIPIKQEYKNYMNLITFSALCDFLNKELWT